MGKRKNFTFEINDNGCFVCTSHKQSKPNTTPITYKDGKKMSIARFIYEVCYGEIKNNLVVRHKCDNSMCINPEHLETGTQLENIQDMVKRGRSTKGERNPSSKITSKIAKEIKMKQGELAISKVSERYGISISQVWRIWAGENWKEVI